MSRDEERDQVERKMIEMQGSINRLREERDKAFNAGIEAAVKALRDSGRPVNCIATVAALATPLGTPGRKP
jgi:O-succinylbenzoate synthase